MSENKRYRGCIATSLLDKKTWTKKPKTLGQKWELTKREAENMKSQMKGLPIRIDHNKKFTVGKVIDAMITPDNKWEIEFEIFDDQLVTRHVLEKNFPVELSLSHYMHLQKPEEVSLCWSGCREGCQVYKDKNNNIQNDTNNHLNDNTNNTSINDTLLIQASISQVLKPVDSHIQTQNHNMSTTQQAAPVSGQASTPVASQPSQQQQQQQQQPPVTSQDPMYKDHTGLNTMDAKDVPQTKELSAEESMNAFHDAMTRLTDIKILSGQDKKIISDGVLDYIRNCETMKQELEAKMESEKQLKARVDEFQAQELKNKENMKQQVDQMCEAFLQMPFVNWGDGERARLREMSAAGELDKLYQAVGPQLVECSLTAAKMVPTEEQQHEQQVYEEEQQRVLPWNQQLARVMNKHNIGMRPFDGQNRMQFNAQAPTQAHLTTSSTMIDPVRCSVKRNHQTAFYSKPNLSSTARTTTRPSALDQLPSEVRTMFDQAVDQPMRFDPVAKQNYKKFAR